MRTQIQPEDHLISLTDALFCQVEIKDIISGRLYYDEIDYRDAAELIFRLEDRYELHSHLECERICEEISDRIAQRDRMRMRISRRGYFHAFELLGDAAERLLLCRNGEVLCRFSYILNWRELVNNLGEELPLAVMYAIQDTTRGHHRKFFQWPFVTKHDNRQLDQIMQKGISDYHFHLWPSGPYFHLSWINLMNRVVDSEYTKNLQELDERKRIIKTRENDSLAWEERIGTEGSMTLLQLQAALIRIYLWSRLNGICFNTEGSASEELCGDELIRYLERIRECGWHDSSTVILVCDNCRKLVYCPEQEGFIDGDCFLSIDRFLSDREFLRHSHLQIISGEELDLTYVMYLLNNPLSLRMESSRIQSMVNSVAAMYELSNMDYALFPTLTTMIPEYPYSYLFVGERRFLYQMMCDVFVTHPRLNRQEHNLFYAYLCLQAKLRREMIQTNNKVGFDNFATFQDTKDFFAGDDNSLRRIAQLAIFDPLQKMPYLQELEVRLTPRSKAQENRDRIQWLDRAVADCVRYSDSDYDWFDEKNELEISELKRRYYYVFHFPKKADPEINRFRFTNPPEYHEPQFECRHAWYRSDLAKKATALSNFRTAYPEIASRVHGIDECSQEIGCRPEVFATAFRRLNRHVSYRGDLLERIPLPQLRITYHVGEDFLDIVDGMRAIDEAIRFLNLQNGDRLGHAIALGMDPMSWYEAKGFRVTLLGQDYLDNLAWLYGSLQRFQIEGCELYLRKLKRKFDHYFRQIYLEHIDSQMINQMMENAIQYYHENHMSEVGSYSVHNCTFGIEEYYLSWLLRGDDPGLYKLGYYQATSDSPDNSIYLEINENNPESCVARFIPECAMLYSFYHYNRDIKRAGAANISIHIDTEDVHWISEVQSAMRYAVADRRLAVECNPTSNVKIGAFRRYQSHPLSTFYNIGLAHSSEELRGCAQMNVSINTDDQGVFFTSIENEFAVMARAMEIAEDMSGNTIYQEWEVADWIDHIREQGNQQGF